VKFFSKLLLLLLLNLEWDLKSVNLKLKSESKKFQTKLLKAENIYISLNFCIQRLTKRNLKVKKFQRNYLESEKFFL